MARKPTRKELTRLLKRLSGDDRERVLKFAERLAESDSGGDPESLVEGDSRPSYMAAVSEDEYKRKKAHKEKRERVYGQG
jgi:hypothetical protein